MSYDADTLFIRARQLAISSPVACRILSNSTRQGIDIRLIADIAISAKLAVERRIGGVSYGGGTLGWWSFVAKMSARHINVLPRPMVSARTPPLQFS
jgi:hypothetical protein